MRLAIRVFLVVTFLLGVLVDVSLAQSENVLVSFDNNNGGWPISTLVYDPARAAFYGTASIGGPNGDGMVFQLKQDQDGSWKTSVLYNFGGIGSQDCAEPDYGVTPVLKKGVITALYGTCYLGGANSYGAIFELTAQPDGSWTEQIIYSFQSISDGANPVGGVTLDRKGNLYGATQVGGSGYGGTVYKLSKTKSGWTKTILHNFGSPANPECHLIFDSKGALYGTTPSDGPTFSGTVFDLVPPAQGQTDWTYSVLYTFDGLTGTGDGATPRAGLVLHGKGELYGTTEGGGNAGLGTVFALAPPGAGQSAWTENQLYRFTTVRDGAGPVGGLTFGKAGVIYGTTSAGGAFNGGTAFQLKRKHGTWNETTLRGFGAIGDGATPWAAMLLESGSLYGTTKEGGAYGAGVVYQITP